MGEADSSENGLSENSSAKKFSFTKIAQLISGHNANDHEGAVIDVDAYENLDANLDEETRSRASDLFVRNARKPNSLSIILRTS